MELISLPLIVDILMESAQGFSWFYCTTYLSRLRGPILKSKSTVQVGRPIGCTLNCI